MSNLLAMTDCKQLGQAMGYIEH